MREIGSPRADAQAAFDRSRRRAAVNRLLRRLRREPADVSLILPFEEVVSALGRTGERSLGLKVIPLDSIVGTVDRSRDFDRGFRPTSPRTRERWERIAAAVRRGESMPPIDVFRVGDLHFVKDGHHRVSVARALELDTIDAFVTEITTAVPAGPGITAADLPLKSHERLFRERVPLPPGLHAEIHLKDEWRYAALAEGVEAWGFRAMQHHGKFMTREEVALAWYREEYRPVVALLREAQLVKPGQETLGYLRVVALRYLLLRTHEWNEETVERLLDALERPGAAGEDTLVQELRQGIDPRASRVAIEKVSQREERAVSDEEKAGAARKEEEMREHEAEARERSDSESDGPLDDELGTPDSDANPAPPGNIQGGNLGGAS